jgi:hypothetical protein
VDPLFDGAVAKDAPPAIALDYLHLEALLIWPAAGPSEDVFGVLEKLEWQGVNLVAGLDSYRQRAELDQKRALEVVRKSNPTPTDRALTAFVQDCEDRQPKPSGLLDCLNLGEVSACRPASVGIVIDHRVIG